MRRTRLLLVLLLVLVLLVGVGVGFYFKFVDTRYFEAEFYADTAIVPDNQQGKPGNIVFQEQEGRLTVALKRGEPHGIITTEHEWWETIYIEVPPPSEGANVLLDQRDVRVAFFSYKLRQIPTVGQDGIRGYLKFESVSPRRIIASYDILIDGIYPRFNPESQHREIRFAGRSTFYKQVRPAGELGGEIWPKVPGK